MPAYAKQFKDHWTPAICMQFLSDFLSRVKDVLKEVDSKSDVYLFEYDPKSMGDVKCEAFKGPNKYSFLIQSYVDFVENVLIKNKR